jgi:hypothetical protein
MNRQGYDATGAAASYLDNLIVTQRVRQPYPSQASLTASTVALHDFLYSTDSGLGVTNNSTLLSPTPIANWALVDRMLVGNSLRAEVVAFHRDARAGKPVACVVFTVTDGVTTITQTVATPTILAHPGDKNPVIGYAADINISTLADGQITLNAKVYPWIGGTASIADSSTGLADSRYFCPKTYTKNVTRFAAPYVAYLSATGNDGTGVTSTTAASARAAPYATLNALMVSARTTMPSNRVGGLRVRFMDGFTGGYSANISAITYQTSADPEVVFEPDPADTGTGVYTFGAGNYTTQLLYLRIKGLTVTRVSAGSRILGLTNGKITMESCNFDNGSYSLPWVTTAHSHFMGTTITNGGANLLNPAASEHRLIRGVTYGTAGTQWTVENWLVLGCNFTGVAFGKPSTGQSGGIHAFNKNMKLGGSATPFSHGQSETITGFALVQNLIEYISATANPAVQVSADSGTGNTSQVLHHHNTYTGFFNNGRDNLLYNETAGTLRTHTLHSLIGNIHNQLNTKHDVFAGANSGLSDANLRIGGWSYLYGVGCHGEFSQFIDATSGGVGGPFAQAFPGFRSNLGTSSTVRNDPVFVNYQGTTSGPTAGSGGGDYRITAATSPCVGKVAVAVLPYTLDGVARPTTNDNSGALSST